MLVFMHSHKQCCVPVVGDPSYTLQSGLISWSLFSPLLCWDENAATEIGLGKHVENSDFFLEENSISRLSALFIEMEVRQSNMAVIHQL